MFCPQCCPLEAITKVVFLLCVFVFCTFLLLFAHCLFQASITAAATGSLHASVSNCDKFQIFFYPCISTHCDFQLCGIDFFSVLKHDEHIFNLFLDNPH